MKIICEKEKIIKALNSVTKAVASKPNNPILEGILIQTNNNELKLTTYDLEIGIEYIIDCEVEEEGAIVVNATMFSEIIRKLPNTDISISVNDKNLFVIECEGSLYKLATMNPSEFPELPQISIENSIQIEQNNLKDMIRKTIFAVSTEENRPIFTGCLFEIKNNKLKIETCSPSKGANMNYYNEIKNKLIKSLVSIRRTQKMNDTGWISLYRKFTEWEWYTDANTMRVFLHLLLKANIYKQK